MQLTTFNLYSCEQSSRSTRAGWEKAFETNQLEFSRKTADGIVQKLLVDFQKSLSDPFKASPSKKSPLVTRISFEIVKSKNALALKEYASDAAELPPLKEWFDKFAIPDQKISNDPGSMNSSRGSQSPETEKGIDRKYFQELIAYVGKSVASRVKESLDQLSSSSENSRLKAEVTWYRKEEQLISNPSDFTDNQIEIKLWLEGEDKNQLKTINSSALGIIEKQRAQEKETQMKRQVLYCLGAIGLITALFIYIFSKKIGFVQSEVA